MYIYLHGHRFKKLLALRHIKPKAEAKLGFLCSDNKGEKENESAVMKCKGIVQKVLRADIYKEGLTKDIIR